MNEMVTLEIVEYLLELYPRTIHSCLDISYGCIDTPDEDSQITSQSLYGFSISTRQHQCLTYTLFL